MRICALLNQKGGVGKSTLAVSIGHALAMRGFKCLVVDLDSQANLAVFLGLQPAPGIFRLLVGKEPILDVIVKTGREKLDLLPSDKETATAKMVLSGQNFRERALADPLGNINDYDYCLLDGAPSIDVLHVAALVASDYLLVPCAVEFASVVGLGQVMASLAEVQEQGYHVRLLGIVPTFFDEVTNESRTVLSMLQNRFGQAIYPPVHRDTKLREAPAFSQTIWEYAPKARAAEDLERVVERFVRDV